MSGRSGCFDPRSISLSLAISLAFAFAFSFAISRSLFVQASSSRGSRGRLLPLLSLLALRLLSLHLLQFALPLLMLHRHFDLPNFDLAIDLPLCRSRQSQRRQPRADKPRNWSALGTDANLSSRFGPAGLCSGQKK